VIRLNLGRQNNRTKQIVKTALKIVVCILVASASYYFCLTEYEFQQVFGHWGNFYETLITCIGILLVLFLILFKVFDAMWRFRVIGSILIVWLICLLIINIQYACC
jgi:flagellar biosynthesis protein FlhB